MTETTRRTSQDGKLPLVQARTGKIGLRAFLFERRVPDVMTPVCACGDGRETETAIWSGSEGPYQGSLPDSMVHAEAAARRILLLQIVDSEELVAAPPAEEMGHRILS